MTRHHAGAGLACFLGVLSLSFAACESPSTNPASNPDAQRAVAVAEAFLEAIGKPDTVALRLHSLPEARLVAVSDDASAPPRVTSLDEFVGQVRANEGRFWERMWSPQAQVDGRLAHVWTEYDFHRDGEFSHCGIDSFDLVRMGHDWKVLSIVYTVHPEGCDPSPLGDLPGTLPNS